jgi:DNA-binding NtrC family response regulator
MSRLLVVEDEQITRESLCKLLQRNGYDVASAASLKAASQLGELSRYDLIISDLRLPGEPGSELLSHQPPLPVLIMTSYASLRSAVEIMRCGAIDYISKPFEQAEMLATVARALNHRRATEPKLTQLELIGSSAAACAVREQISALSNAAKPILISGESGAGKSLAARLLHKLSGAEQLLHFNCAADHSREQLAALLAAADENSCLVLDHIGLLQPALQEQLLNALNGNQIRLIALSEKPIEALETLSQPLLFRLGARRLAMPPLRQRSEDIVELTEFLLAALAGRDDVAVEPCVAQALLHYPWPGNIRELRNLLEQALAAQPGANALTASALPEPLRSSAKQFAEQQRSAPAAATSVPLTLSLEQYFCEFVLANQANMSETELAKGLGISRKSLWERRQKLELKRPGSD